MSDYIESRERDIFQKQRAVMKHLGVTDPVILDIGANRGQSVEAYRQLFPNAQFHCFEPNPEAADILAEANRNDPAVKLHRIALAEVEGTLPFYKTAVQEASSLLQPSELLMKLSVEHKYDYELLQVPVKTLDSFAGSIGVERADIMKMDVQGAELRVLLGADLLFENHRISALYMEITHAETYENQAGFAELVTFLSSKGYVLWDILPFVYTVSGRVWVSNALFLSPEAAAEVEQNCRAQG